jgi:beta-galactosidase
MFIADKLGEDLRERYEAVKAAAPQAPATSHAAGVGLFASPHWWEGQSDDWIMARQVDLYGTSFYPKHSAFVDRDPVWRGALLDFTRSFGYAEGRQGFVIGELQAGFGTIAANVSPEVTPEDLRIWAWSAVSRGAKGIHFYAFYPMSTGYEAGGFGLIHLDGTLTERAKEAGRFAQAVARHEKLLEAARPPRAEVAVIYNPLAHFVGGRQRQAAYGGPQGEVAGIERDSLLGFYKALWAENVPVDFVHAGALSAESLEQYRLVYLPYPPMLPSSAGGVLREFVRAGGRLVAEARAGWNSEAGRASEIIPGMGLHEVFGAREASVETVPAGRAVVVFEDGLRVPGRWFREVLAPLGGRVAARFEDGSPAAVEAAYGKGKALLVGSYPAAAYHSAPSEDARRWFVSLLDWAGVERKLVAEGGVEARWLESGGGRIVFVFNHDREAKQVRLRWREQADWRITDLLADRRARATFELAGRSVAVLLFERE